jgi:hypothetical protein
MQATDDDGLHHDSLKRVGNAAQNGILPHFFFRM